ncbi:MAG: hypothetical protein EPN36_14365 [Rhodanobacteraceae bacterium]|nr:MAG: hypothetical protein EPN36_14365 [Rhodanobacteraceae bacterium]
MKWFAVQGRVPGDDDDTVLVFQAEDAEDAKEQFRDEMRGNRSQEAIDACDERHDSNGGVFIISVLESDSVIRVVA